MIRARVLSDAACICMLICTVRRLHVAIGDEMGMVLIRAQLALSKPRRLCGHCATMPKTHHELVGCGALSEAKEGKRKSPHNALGKKIGCLVLPDQ